jgi:hypothetical protein
VDFTATYSVPYTPGELKAVGYTGGVCDGEFTLRTAQDAQMTLTADRKTLHSAMPTVSDPVPVNR